MPRKFDFISPGIELREVDESQITPVVEDDGLLVVGQARTGPSGKPVQVKTLNELYSVFGRPQSGVGAKNNDVWRDGNQQITTYGLYAAQAWLASGTSPVKYIRLLGEDQATAKQGSGYTQAGWGWADALTTEDPATTYAAWGLFVMASSSLNRDTLGAQPCTLGAIFYTSGSTITLSGTLPADIDGLEQTAITTSSIGLAIKSDLSTTAGFTVDVWTSTTAKETFSFNFDSTDKSNFIRNCGLNTNPQKLESINYGGTAEKYFLGETFETRVNDVLDSIGSGSAGSQIGFLLPLQSGSTANTWTKHLMESKPAKTGWFINRNPSNNILNTGSYTPANMKKIISLGIIK